MKPGIIIRLDNQYGTYGMVTGQTGNAVTVRTDSGLVLAYEPEFVQERIVGCMETDGKRVPDAQDLRRMFSHFLQVMKWEDEQTNGGNEPC